jgi:diamine N-acetyltransferase
MIQLRKIEPQDLPFLYRWENDAAAWADGANHNPLSQQDLRAYIESTTGDIYRDGQLRLIIESYSAAVLQRSGLTAERSYSPKDGLTLGCIDLFDFDPRNRRAAIGMYIAPEFRGKGVGHEAVKALEKYAFEFLNLRVLYAIIATSNTACTALYKNEGYRPSSLLTQWTLESDATLWLKTNSDYEQKD